MKYLQFILLVSLFALSHQESLRYESPLDYTTDFTTFMEQQVGYKLNFSCISGHVPIDEYYPDGNSALHFTLFTKQGQIFKDIIPTTNFTVWFQGGPGSSSQFGSFMEMGPFIVDKDQKVSLREFSWNQDTMIMFIDQPLGVGFSQQGDKNAVNSTEQAASHIINFFQNFYKAHPNTQRNPVHFWGESYAGHYVPAFASAIIRSLKLPEMNIAGIAIGDGIVGPADQIPYYSQYMYSIGIASSGRRKKIMDTEFKCSSMIRLHQWEDATDLFYSVLDDEPELYGNIDVYNYEKYVPLDEFYVKFLKDHITDITTVETAKLITFQSSNEDVYKAFKADICKSYKSDLQYLINTLDKVLIFQGQLDIIINTPGNTAFVNTLRFDGQQEWKDQIKRKLTSGGLDPDVYGTYKSNKGFCFAQVYGAGHMVPMDKPKEAFKLYQDYFIGFNEIH